MEEELLNVGSLSDEERRRYERLVAERDELQRNLDSKRKQEWAFEKKSVELERKLADARKHAEEKRSKVGQNRITQDRITTARRLGALFAEFKRLRKQEQRSQLEEAINQHFKILMTSHRLIDRVELDEDFGLHYRDANRSPVATGNLAAGMKQLMATSLLWALSEVSGKRIPVVVDTPLARIDLAHQEGILRHYYPNAATQVIVLPTDAELDPNKLALISPHVYRAYRLRNRDGEHTVAEPVDVADLLRGG